MSELFDFIKSFDVEIYNNCMRLENAIYNRDYYQAVLIGRGISEDLTSKIANQESINVQGLSQYDKMVKLSNFGVFDRSIENPLNSIRRTANNIAHDTFNANMESALRVHRNIYDCLHWYYGTYSEDESHFKPRYNFDPLPPVQPIPSHEQEIIPQNTESEEGTTFDKKSVIISEEKIESAPVENEIEEKIEQDELDSLLDSFSFSDDDSEEKKDSENNLSLFDSDLINQNLEFEKLNGSFLLKELSKLKDSSHESVEGYESLSEFKQYLHVTREIQEELFNKLNEVKDKSSSQLVMLCGSVGDGKSHLLAYLNSNYPELMSNFRIHNDATESFDPDKTAIDTLANVLKEFDNDHINNSNEKLILAINLGVLNNFMESDYAKERYSKLNGLLNETNIFDSEATSQNYDKDPIHIISFSDYNLFELYENHVDSEYLKKLFKKITDKDKNNPFYQAYLRDIANEYNGPIRYNYELLMNEKVITEITQLVINAIIKFKRIVSTRELLNFIYEIIVPPVIKEYDKIDEVYDYMEEILPNLIYTTSERSPLLKIIAMHDPIHLRREILDDFLIKLNMTNDLTTVIKEYLMECDETTAFIESIGNNNITEFRGNEDMIINTIIRYSSILGINEIKHIFTRDSYREFTHYLYVYNTNNKSGFKDLFEKVKGAVFRWKGSPKKNYILIEELSNFNIAEKIDLKPVLMNSKDMGDDLNNRFKTDILLKFKVNNKENIIPLSIDYTLYRMITKLNNGYKPNKNDKEDLVIFNEFIDELIKNGSSDEELLIEDINNKLNFTLEFDSTFDEFKFEQVE